MYTLTRLECENFIGLFNGLAKKRLVLDLTEYMNKSLFVLIGDNAHGKSTLLSILHPFSGTTDKRDRFIREGKEGYKEIIYTKVDEPVKIRIRHVYVPNKTGGHSTKSFIFKTVGHNDELDLNPNGNVSTFLLAIEQEFGITEDFLKLASQNEDMAGLVKMTSSSRKDYMYVFIPKADDTTIYQKIVAGKYRDVRTYLSSLVDKIGKMEDLVTINERLKAAEEIIHELVEKRDRNIGKINAYRAQIEALDSDNTLMEKYKSIKKELKELDEEHEKLHNKYIKFIADKTGYEAIDLSTIDTIIAANTSKRSSVNDKIIHLSAVLSSKKEMKSNLYDQISEKEVLVSQLSGTNSYDDLTELLATYQSKLSAFDDRLKSLKTSISAEDLIRGIDVLGNLREFLYDVYNFADNKDNLIAACDSDSSSKIEKKYLNTKSELDAIRSKMDKLTSSIMTLNTYSDTKTDISKRPKECKIDDCGFLTDYNKWKELEHKIIDLQDELTALSKQYDKYNTQLETLSEIYEIRKKIDSLLAFYKNNLSLLSKLPFNNKYATQESLLKSVSNYDTLAGVEDKFYDMIEILQEKEDYEQLRNVKIPLLKAELEGLKNNQSLIKAIQSDMDRLSKKYEKENHEIGMDQKVLLEHQENLEDIDVEQENLLELKERLTAIADNKAAIISLSDKFDKIKDTSERISQLNEEIKERKEKLNSIEEKLKPATKERDYYKYQEIKLKEYEMEKEFLEQNLKILTVMRDALSTSKGMPVKILNLYVDSIRRAANLLLSECYNGTLYLEQFVIDEKEFTIPFQHSGDRGKDVSDASSSERSFISTCLSMGVMEQILAQYGVITLDEVDRGMSEHNRRIYASILTKQMKRVGINQAFLATHSKECYEQYDVCFILFPGHTLDTKGKDYIKVY